MAEKKNDLLKAIIEAGKGALSIALLKQLGIDPNTKGNRVAKGEIIDKEKKVKLPVEYRRPVRKARAGMSPAMMFTIGGIAIGIIALLLFRRK